MPVIGDLFHLTYIHNYGAAFSILQDHRVLLIIFPIIVMVIIMTLIVKFRKHSHGVFLFSLSLIAGGGIGNLIDRIAYGYVVDFFDLKIWPIFNIADISVCAGCLLLIIYIVFIEPKILKQKDRKHE